MAPPSDVDRSGRTSRVEAFFDDFDRAFASFDGAVIAARYAEPYLACRSDGTSERFESRADTADYFAGVLDTYAAMGVRTCAHRDVLIVDVGAHHVLATVTWDLADSTGQVVISWRESYLLVADSGRLLVRTSIDH